LASNKADLDAKDKDESEPGRTPLHVAAIVNNAKAASILIEKGAFLNSKTDKGNTPLHTALTSNSLDIIKLLGSKGADYYQRNKENISVAQSAIKIAGDIKRIFMDAIGVEDDREFDIVESGYKKRHRAEGDYLTFEWHKSTQFGIIVTEAAKVKIINHFIGTGSVMDASSKVGFCLVKGNDGKHCEISYQTSCIGFGTQEPFSAEFEPNEKYAIIPYAQEQETKGKFSITVYSQGPEVTFTPLTPWKHKKTVPGDWKGESAAGCNTGTSPWKLNPHFKLKFNKEKEKHLCHIALEQQKSDFDLIPFEVHPYAFHIGVYIYDKEVEEMVAKSKTWQNAREVYQNFKFNTTNHKAVIIIPTTVKPQQETTFTLSVFSDYEIELEKFNPPKIVDVK